ncbi:MAG TPA: acyl carrier protein [Thermoanaerobaculia bacterium]
MIQTAEDLRATVFSVLAEIAPEADAASVDAAESLREQLDLDSMDFLNFVIGLHKRLGVEIPESDYSRLSSINGVIAYLGARAR